MSNKDMFLYWGSGSGPCVRVIAVLAEKGLWDGCPNKKIEFSKKEHKSEEVLKLNPRGQVPTFKDGDTIINESTAICLYLDEKYGGNKLIPTDMNVRAQVYQRLVELSNLDAWVAAPLIRYRMLTPKEKWDETLLKEKIPTADTEIKRWDAYMSGKKNLVGEQFSMADLFLYTELAFFQRFGLKLEKYPNLQRFFESHKERPSLKTSSPPHWKETPGFNYLADLNL